MTPAKSFVSQQLLISATNGVEVVPSASPLTALNYFDGKFLRAEDLQTEQDYVRALVKTSNRAGGSGAVHGFDVGLSDGGDSIAVSPGLAVDGLGNVLLMPASAVLSVAKLIDGSPPSPRPPPLGLGDFMGCASDAPSKAQSQLPSSVYLLTVGYAEKQCGAEDVFGQLCDRACATSENQRYRIEGVRFRAVPIQLDTSPWFQTKVIANEAKYQRSVLASAFYAGERQRVISLISGQGLRAGTWCLGAAEAAPGDVPLGLFLRSNGSSVTFLDAWTARRERIEASPRRYWDARMAMRPWDAFLAQILQFQCQLADLLSGASPPAVIDPCAKERQAMASVAHLLARIQETFEATAKVFRESEVEPPISLAELKSVRGHLDSVTRTSSKVSDSGWLLRQGIVELPPAGYLPIDEKSPLTVNEQVRRFVDDSLDLRFCIVRPDYVPHAVEMRQHMERISLLDGLVNPAAKPEVDILVPSGKLITTPKEAAGREFKLTLTSELVAGGIGLVARTAVADGPSRPKLSDFTTSFTGAAIRQPLGLEGAARLTRRTHGSGYELVLAASRGQGDAPAVESAAREGAEKPVKKKQDAKATASHVVSEPALYLTLSTDVDPFGCARGDTFPMSAGVDLGVGDKALLRVSANATLAVTDVRDTSAGSRIVEGVLMGQYGTRATLADTDTRDGAPFSVAIRLQRGAAAGSGLVVVGLGHGPNELVRLTWDTARRTGVLSIPRLERDFKLADFEEQDDVLETSNRWNDEVVTALDTLERLIVDDGTWRGRANAKLWPVLPSSQELDVLATLDWVLFCRRRSALCELDVAPVPPKRFQVWAVSIGRQTLDEQRRLAALMDPIKFPRTAVGVVEFDGYVLRDPLGALAQWNQFDPAHTHPIVWAGVGMKTNPDPDAIEINRLAAYEGVLAASGVPASTAREVLSPIPHGYAVPGTDGSIILVVAERPAKIFKAQVFFQEQLPDLNLKQVRNGRPLGIHEFDEALLTRDPGKIAIRTLDELSERVKGLPDLKSVVVFIPKGGLTREHAERMGLSIVKAFSILPGKVTVDDTEDKAIFKTEGVDAIIGLLP